MKREEAGNMSDDTTAILEFLRVRFDHLDAGQARIETRLDELTNRIDGMERLLADLQVQAALRGSTWRG